MEKKRVFDWKSQPQNIYTYFMDVRAHKIIELIEDPVNNFNK